MSSWTNPYFDQSDEPHIPFRDLAGLAGRRLPYLTGEYDQPATGLYRPDYVEFMLVTRGEGRRTLRSADGNVREWELHPGELHFFRPMDYNAMVPVGREGFSVICVSFAVQTWERFAMASELDLRPFTMPDPPMIRVSLDDPERIRPFRNILDEWRRRLDAMDLMRFLATITPWFTEAAKAEDASGAPAWLRTAVAAMHEEENLRVGISRLNELAHVSHTHLWRNTHAYFGLAPSDLVNEIRLHHATLLLATTDLTIATIAQRCGYSSAAHFSTAFRRRRHVPPRDYRAQTRLR